MPPPPLHERVRRLLPKKVLDALPERVKPPAWRHVPLDPPPETRTRTERPQRAVGELRFIWGDPALIWSGEPDGGVTVTLDSKGKEIAPVRLRSGTTGRMVAVGPDFVVLQVGEGTHARRYRVPKDAVINTKPEHERRLGCIEITEADLVA